MPSRSSEEVVDLAGDLHGSVHPWKVGDRVRIIRPGQPWHGHSGKIVREFNEQGLDWIVALDEPPGHTSGCQARHLRETFPGRRHR